MELEFLGIGILTWITFVPIAGMVAVLFIPKEQRPAMKWIAALATFAQVVMAVVIYFNFNKSLPGINTTEGMQFVEKATWIDVKSVPWSGRIQIEYFLGVDGLSVSMVLLTALISFIAVFASWNIEKALKGYIAMLLLLDTGMMGVFVSLDFFVFYVFWEDNPSVIVWSADHIIKLKKLHATITNAIGKLTEWLLGYDPPLYWVTDQFVQQAIVNNKTIKKIVPGIIVVDNLNIAKDDDKLEFFENLMLSDIQVVKEKERMSY